MGAACDLQMLKESRVWFGAATLTHMKRIYIYSITEKMETDAWNQQDRRPGEKKCPAKHQQPTDSNSSAINPDRLTVTRLVNGALIYGPFGLS
jgi:hypothetical protein